jgi:hypothetical protein
MEGTLEVFDSVSKGMFKAGGWKKYFFILHHEILVFTDVSNTNQVVGKLHMSVSKLLNEDSTFIDCELRINSGLIDLRLKAASIQEKVNWKNAFIKSQKVDSRQVMLEQRLNRAKDDAYIEQGHRSSLVPMMQPPISMQDSSRSPLIQPKKNSAAGTQNMIISPKEILSDYGSHNSIYSDQMLWSEVLNTNFSTNIFSKNNDYILEMGNIYSAKQTIDEALS